MLDLPEELAGLASLRKLWVTQNALRSLPASLAQLSTLQALLAANNLFKEVPPVSGPDCSMRVNGLCGMSVPVCRLCKVVSGCAATVWLPASPSPTLPLPLPLCHPCCLLWLPARR